MDQHKHQYRRLIGRFATGVAVVVGEAEGDIVGMTVNSLTSVSLDPLLLLFCARNESRTARRIVASGRFSVNVLRNEQQHVSNQFAGRAAIDIACCGQQDGFAWIEDANATFLCELQEVFPGGDHKIVLGRVVGMAGPDMAEAPLVFFEGQYTALREAALQSRDTRSPTSADATAPGARRPERSCLV